MPGAADVFRRVDETHDLSSGDIAFLSLARTRTVGEGPPGEAFDRRIPAYPRPALRPLPHGREIAIDTHVRARRHAFLRDRPPEEPGRIRGPLRLSPDGRSDRPRAAVSLVGPDGEVQPGVSWSAIEHNDPVRLPGTVRSIDDQLVDRPGGGGRMASFVRRLRGLTTVSRRMVAADRLCGLTPAYLGMLQRQLARLLHLAGPGEARAARVDGRAACRDGRAPRLGGGSLARRADRR